MKLSKDEVSLSDEEKIDLGVVISSKYWDSIEWEVSDPFVVALDGYINGSLGSTRTEEVTLLAVGNGKATITATVYRRGKSITANCNVEVSGFDVDETEYSWWYYELDTSRISDYEYVGLIFNCMGTPQTNDIENVQSKGEVFYKWNGEDRTVYVKIDKSEVEESILQTELNTENNLVVYVCVPVKCRDICVYSWDYLGAITDDWPGVPMKSCSQGNEVETPTPSEPVE